MQRLRTRSLYNVSIRDLHARSLSEISIQDLFTRSPKEISWQDLCERSLVKISAHALYKISPCQGLCHKVKRGLRQESQNEHGATARST